MLAARSRRARAQARVGRSTTRWPPPALTRATQPPIKTTRTPSITADVFFGGAVLFGAASVLLYFLTDWFDAAVVPTSPTMDRSRSPGESPARRSPLCERMHALGSPTSPSRCTSDDECEVANTDEGIGTSERSAGAPQRRARRSLRQRATMMMTARLNDARRTTATTRNGRPTRGRRSRRARHDRNGVVDEDPVRPAAWQARSFDPTRLIVSRAQSPDGDGQPPSLDGGDPQPLVPEHGGDRA
jgi:hypothetical protein